MSPAAARVHRGTTTDVLWKLEPSTEAKHRLYKRYLDAWWPIMLQQAWVTRLTYVDAFAGPGEYEDGEEGSPTFVLDRLLHHEARDRMDLRRERVTLIFIEGDKARYEHLCELLVTRFGPLEALPVTVVVKHGRAESDTLPLLTQTGAWGSPILAVFDSWGNVAVPLEQLERIAKNRSSEVVVTFGANWFSRREKEDPTKLDAVFGGPQYWQPSDPTTSAPDRWRAWLAFYRDALLRVGFGFSLPFQVVPKTGQPLDLVFGTTNPRGVEVFKQAMWNVDQTDGMRFCDPRTTAARKAEMAAIQPSLFDDLEAPTRSYLALWQTVLPRGRAHSSKCVSSCSVRLRVGCPSTPPARSSTYSMRIACVGSPRRGGSARTPRSGSSSRQVQASHPMFGRPTRARRSLGGPRPTA